MSTKAIKTQVPDNATAVKIRVPDNVKAVKIRIPTTTIEIDFN